jgi:WD40 repeat protein
MADRYGLKAAVWDVVAGTRAVELGGASHLGMAFHPDGHVLATGGADGLWLWEGNRWGLLKRMPGTSSLMEYSADGRILASVAGGGEPCAVQLLDGHTLEELATLTPPETYTTTDLAFSPDGALLAQITNHAGVVHVWDLRRIRERLGTMGLDWDLPPFKALDASGSNRVTIEIEQRK